MTHPNITHPHATTKADLSLVCSEAYKASPTVGGLRFVLPELEYNGIRLRAPSTGTFADYLPVIAVLDRLPPDLIRDMVSVETTGGIEPRITIHSRGRDPADLARRFDGAFGSACPDKGHAGIEVHGTLIEVATVGPRAPDDDDI